MSKRNLTVLLKIAVSAGLIYLVFHQVDWKKCGDQMAGSFREGYGWLVAAVALVGVTFALSAWRWRRLLRAHDIAIPFFRTFRFFLVGFFFSQFMPGGLAAGDVIRSYYVASYNPEKKTEGVATVVLDRVVGFSGLVTLVVISLLLGGQYLVRCLMVIGITGSVGIGIVLFFSKRVLKKLPFAGWVYEHLPYQEYFTRVYEAFRHYRKHKSQLLVCWGQSVIIQGILVFVAYCVGHSVGVEATGLQYLVWVPLVGVIASLPITFGNIGTAEAGYRFFFLQGNHPEGYGSVVLAFALMMRLLWLLVGAVGGIVWWAEKAAISPRLLRGKEDIAQEIFQSGGDVSAHSAGEGE